MCDVSGSVSAYAKFLLMFLYSLYDVLPRVRSFAFSNHLGEVSELFDQHPVEKAVELVNWQYGGATDYGNSLMDFAKLALDDIDSQTTVIILGDARNNNGDPRLDIMQSIYARAKQVIWLNPESRSVGQRRSEMPRYLSRLPFRGGVLEPGAPGAHRRPAAAHDLKTAPADQVESRHRLGPNIYRKLYIQTLAFLLFLLGGLEAQAQVSSASTALVGKLDLEAHVVLGIGILQRLFLADLARPGNSLNSAWSKVCMPISADFSMISLMPSNSPLRISSAMVGVPSRISMAAQRLPSTVGTRRCETKARSWRTGPSAVARGALRGKS